MRWSMDWPISSKTNARDRIRPYIVKLRDKETVDTADKQRLRKDQAQVIAEVCSGCCRVVVQMLHGGPPVVMALFRES